MLLVKMSLALTVVALVAVRLPPATVPPAFRSMVSPLFAVIEILPPASTVIGPLVVFNEPKCVTFPVASKSIACPTATAPLPVILPAVALTVRFVPTLPLLPLFC